MLPAAKTGYSPSFQGTGYMRYIKRIAELNTAFVLFILFCGKMKILFFVVVFVVAISAIHGSNAGWEAYKKNFRKTYRLNSTDDVLRAGVFLKKDAEIKVHNRDPSRKFNLTHSFFSDLTDEEKKAYHGLNRDLSDRLLEVRTVDFAVEDRQRPPASLDYRSDPCLPPVKNQGACGSCWAFAAITPLEFAHCKKRGNVSVVLSEQQLVDCDRNNNGCNGGWYTNAWYYQRYIAAGAATQRSYAYTAKKGTCRSASSMIGARVSTYGNIQANNATAMQIALQRYGPIAVAISVIAPFYSYASGVYTDKTCDTITVNHGVVIVGFGTLNGIDYWIVRNSWGGTWGDKGYILIQRGVNKCKIESYPSFVASA